MVWHFTISSVVWLLELCEVARKILEKIGPPFFKPPPPPHPAAIPTTTCTEFKKIGLPFFIWDPLLYPPRRCPPCPMHRVFCFIIIKGLQSCIYWVWHTWPLLDIERRSSRRSWTGMALIWDLRGTKFGLSSVHIAAVQFSLISLISLIPEVIKWQSGNTVHCAIGKSHCAGRYRKLLSLLLRLFCFQLLVPCSLVIGRPNLAWL